MQWTSEGNADLFLNDIYTSLSNKWNSPDNLDNFTDDNDAGFYWKSYSWRQGIVDPAVNNGTPMDHANANATDYASWAAGFQKIRKCNLYIQRVTENAANFSRLIVKNGLMRSVSCAPIITANFSCTWAACRSLPKSGPHDNG